MPVFWRASQTGWHLLGELLLGQRLDRSNHHHGKSERRGTKRQAEDRVTQGTLTLTQQQATEAIQQAHLQAMSAALSEKHQGCFWGSCRCAGLLE